MSWSVDASGNLWIDGAIVKSGTGDPSGVESAPPGSLYMRRAGATSALYKNTSVANPGTTWTDVSGGGGTTVVLGGDVLNNGTTYADITGLSFAVVNGGIYEFECVGAYDSSAAANGAAFAINGPAAAVSYWSAWSSGTAAMTPRPAVAYDGPAVTSTSGWVADNPFLIKGTVVAAADGTVIMRSLNERNAGTGTITIQAGATLRWQRVA